MSIHAPCLSSSEEESDPKEVVVEIHLPALSTTEESIEEKVKSPLQEKKLPAVYRSMRNCKLPDTLNELANDKEILITEALPSPSTSTNSFSFPNGVDPGYDYPSDSSYSENADNILHDSIHQRFQADIPRKTFACCVNLGGILLNEISDQDHACCVQQCLPKTIQVEQLPIVKIYSDQCHGQSLIFVNEVNYHIIYPHNVNITAMKIQEILIKKLQPKFRVRFGDKAQVKMVVVIDLDKPNPNRLDYNWKPQNEGYPVLASNTSHLYSSVRGTEGPILNQSDFGTYRNQSVNLAISNVASSQYDGMLTVQCDFCYMTSSPIVMKISVKECPIPPLDFTEEAKKITEILKNCEKEVRYCRITATTDNLVRLTQKKVRILHFSGHGRLYDASGTAMTQLMFERDKPELFGMSHNISPQDLKRLIRKDSGLQLVFVSACYSRQAGDAFIRAGAPYVICIRQTDAVDSEAAMLFTKIFYEQILMHNQPIPKAFKFSRDYLVVEKHTAQSKIFELIENPKYKSEMSEENSIISLPEGTLRDVSKELSLSPVQTARIPRARIDLVGNVLFMKKVIQELMTKNLVVIWNNRYRAIGKTAIAIMSAYYIVDRGKVDRSLWVDIDAKRLARKTRNVVGKLPLESIISDILLEEVTMTEGETDRVLKIRKFLKVDEIPGEGRKPQTSKSFYKRGMFSQLIDHFFEDEIVLIILDGADTLAEPKQWLAAAKFRKKGTKKKEAPGHLEEKESKEINDEEAKKSTEEKIKKEEEEWKNETKKCERWTCAQVSTFISEITKKHGNVKILVTCRDWNKIKGNTGSISHELIELPKLELKDAALLFIKSIPVNDQLRSEHFGLKGVLSNGEIASWLSIADMESPTVKATGRIPGVIKQICDYACFQKVRSISHHWDKNELIRKIDLVMCKHKMKYDKIKESILNRLTDNRDDVIADLHRNFSRFAWQKWHIDVVYNAVCIPKDVDMWKIMEKRAAYMEQAQFGWTYIVELENKRSRDKSNEWAKEVQNWKKQLALVFPDKLVRYQHALYATVEVIRRLINPKCRRWGYWETKFCIALIKYLCLDKNVPTWVIFEEIFKEYWKRINDICNVLRDYSEYFDTGVAGPCLLHAFAERATCQKALQGLLCQYCVHNEKQDNYECPKFPKGHPEVPPGTFILRLGIKSKSKFVVGYKDNGGVIRFQEIFDGLTEKGFFGFAEKRSRGQKKTKYYRLPELVMRMEKLKYVFWPSAPIDPQTGKPVNLEKKYCYESSFIPG